MPKKTWHKFEYMKDFGLERMMYLKPDAMFIDIGMLDRKFDDKDMRGALKTGIPGTGIINEYK